MGDLHADFPYMLEKLKPNHTLVTMQLFMWQA